jgi:hypothetical protein
MGSDKTARGYQLADFQDAWRRYLGIEMRRDPDGRFYPVNLAGQHQGAPSPATQEATDAPEAAQEKSEIFNKDKGCNGIAHDGGELVNQLRSKVENVDYNRL